MNSPDVIAVVKGKWNTDARNEKSEQNYSHQTGDKNSLSGPGVAW
jgi:hypothetical protein